MQARDEQSGQTDLLSCDQVHECTCSNSMVSRYQKRISGPLLDRFDIHIEVPRVDYEKLSDDRLGEPSAAIRARVEAARERQRQRFEGTTGCCPTPTWGRARCATSARWTKPAGTCCGRPCSSYT